MSRFLKGSQAGYPIALWSLMRRMSSGLLYLAKGLLLSLSALVAGDGRWRTENRGKRWLALKKRRQLNNVFLTSWRIIEKTKKNLKRLHKRVILQPLRCHHRHHERHSILYSAERSQTSERILRAKKPQRAKEKHQPLVQLLQKPKQYLLSTS